MVCVCYIRVTVMAVFESSHIAEYSNYINNTNAKLSPGTSGLNPGSFQVICE